MESGGPTRPALHPRMTGGPEARCGPGAENQLGLVLAPDSVGTPGVLRQSPPDTRAPGPHPEHLLPHSPRGWPLSAFTTVFQYPRLDLAPSRSSANVAGLTAGRGKPCPYPPRPCPQSPARRSPCSAHFLGWEAKGSQRPQEERTERPGMLWTPLRPLPSPFLVPGSLPWSSPVPLQMLWLLFLTLPCLGGSVPMTSGESCPMQCSCCPEAHQRPQASADLGWNAVVTLVRARLSPWQGCLGL